jgi:hypothetical protein
LADAPERHYDVHRAAAARADRNEFVFAGGALVAIGFMRLWEDFISPMRRP